ncbi:MAG: tyrosine-type recombinase/integrase [Aquirufa antheringensis]|nr:tyrosine-type recombinase/integrase [Aquirufa antheringensis]
MSVESTFCPSCGFKQLKTTLSNAQTDSEEILIINFSFENDQTKVKNLEIECSSKFNLFGFIAVSRHSFAYHMLESGASIEEISFALGHTTVQQIQGYLKQFSQ